MKQYKEEFILSTETIDRVSQLFGEALEEAGTDKRDILRIRLSLEDILGMWMKKLENNAVQYKMVQRFGRLSASVCVEGTQVSPDEDEQGFLFSSRLLAQAGLALEYSYKNGKNYLICGPLKKAQTGQMTNLLFAILAAFLIGGIVKTLPEGAQNIVLEIVNPVFQTILNILRAISSPMIFLAVCWGIISIGDLSAVGKIGKKLIIRMIAGTFAVGSVFALLASPFFKIVWGKNEAVLGGFTDIYTMILDIVPPDIVSPFLNGNALQIVFLGICIGIALLVLGQRVSVIQDIIVQANEVVFFLMGVISKLVPAFVFLSIFNLLLFDADVNVWGIVKVFALTIPGCLLLMLVYVLGMAAKFRISPALIVKKLLPTYLIALSTASSAAAFATNLETCTKKLGIPDKVANFAIPLGQVIYMPGAVIGFLTIVFCMAEYYGVQITVMWMVTAVLTAGLLAMAAPPVPGGGLTIYTIMFAQLGIPGEAVAIAVALNSILDFVMTSSNLLCLQVEVTIASESLELLDKEKVAQE